MFALYIKASINYLINLNMGYISIYNKMQDFILLCITMFLNGTETSRLRACCKYYAAVIKRKDRYRYELCDSPQSIMCAVKTGMVLEKNVCRYAVMARSIDVLKFGIIEYMEFGEIDPIINAAADICESKIIRWICDNYCSDLKHVLSLCIRKPLDLCIIKTICESALERGEDLSFVRECAIKNDNDELLRWSIENSSGVDI
jgi:hypothetical protein